MIYGGDRLNNCWLKKETLIRQFVNVYGITSTSAGAYILNILKVPNSVFSINAENWNIRNKWWNKSSAIYLTCLIKIVTYFLSYE